MAGISKYNADIFIQEYLESKAPERSVSWTRQTRGILRHLVRYLKNHSIELKDLKQADIEGICGQPPDSKPPHRRLITVRGFLIWCFRQGLEVPNPETLFPKYMIERDRWPQEKRVYEFLDFKALTCRHPGTLRTIRTALWDFHRWLHKNQLELRKITENHIENYRSEAGLIPKTANTRSHAIYLRLYLEWLMDHGVISDIDLSGLFPRGVNMTTRKLSSTAREYLSFLPSTKKPKTCARHKVTLCNFYWFLYQQGLNEKQIDRSVTELWLNTLFKKGLKSSTRQHYIIDLRSYFSWMHERGHIKSEPYFLLRTVDIPQRPKLLPRPLSPDIDLEIQCRLESSTDLYDRGVLLMRRTGIRVNELWLMPMDCVYEDHERYKYLKVPLGKMNNERLIPIDNETLGLIQKIQQQSSRMAFKEKSSPSRLIYGPKMGPTFYSRVREAVRKVSEGLATPEPITPHRLRHTFATSLLNGGMSLYGLMRLLGHRHVGTTLVYAAVAQETIRDEYFSAMEKIEAGYSIPKLDFSEDRSQESPNNLLDDLTRSLKKKRVESKASEAAKIQVLIKRLDRIRQELQSIS